MMEHNATLLLGIHCKRAGLFLQVWMPHADRPSWGLASCLAPQQSMKNRFREADDHFSRSWRTPACQCCSRNWERKHVIERGI